MPSDRSKIDYAKSFLRRTKTLEELKLFALEVFAAVQDGTAVTSISFEGGSAGSQITFDKATLGIAIEELIAELDPDYVEPVVIPRGQPWGVLAYRLS